MKQKISLSGQIRVKSENSVQVISKPKQQDQMRFRTISKKLPASKIINTYFPSINLKKQLDLQKKREKRFSMLIDTTHKTQLSPEQNILLSNFLKKKKNNSTQQINNHSKLQNLLKQFAKQSYVPPQQHLQQLICQLNCINIFFKKIPNFIFTSLIKLSNIVYCKPRSKIYSFNDSAQQFYIILYGKISLSYKKQLFKKVCREGEIFGEEVLFQDKERLKNVIRLSNGIFPRIQNARAITKCYLLQISIEIYKRIESISCKCGLKQQFAILENIILREFYEKDSLRHQQFF